MNPRKKIACLFSVHIATWTLSSFAWHLVESGQHVWSTVTFVVCATIFISQVQLLGIWLGLSSSPWEAKLFLVLCGMVLLPGIWPPLYPRYGTLTGVIQNEVLPQAMCIASIAG